MFTPPITIEEPRPVPMPEQPITPTGPSLAPTSTLDHPTDGPVVSTTQIVESIEQTFDVRLDVNAIETLLVELDRRDWIDWVGQTSAGEYVWDLSQTPDRIADRLATIVSSLRSSSQSIADTTD